MLRGLVLRAWCWRRSPDRGVSGGLIMTTCAERSNETPAAHPTDGGDGNCYPCESEVLNRAPAYVICDQHFGIGVLRSFYRRSFRQGRRSAVETHSAVHQSLKRGFVRDAAWTAACDGQGHPAIAFPVTGTGATAQVVSPPNLLRAAHRRGAWHRRQQGTHRHSWAIVRHWRSTGAERRPPLRLIVPRAAE